MHADDADRARRDERLGVIQIHTVSVVDVRKHRPRAEMNERSIEGNAVCDGTMISSPGPTPCN